MRAINSVSAAGHLGRDPELKNTNGGTALCTFSMALSEKYKGKDGNMVERPNWVNFTAWGKTAEAIAKYVKKGDPLYVEGSLKVDEYEKDGQKRTSVSVTVNNFVLLGQKSDAPAATVPDFAFSEEDEAPF